MTSKEIDNAIKKEKESLTPGKHVRVLMLGPADCGKTTVLKQLILHHGRQFKQQEKQFYKDAIYSNIISTMLRLIDAMNGLEYAAATDGNDFGSLASHISENLLVS